MQYVIRDWIDKCIVDTIVEFGRLIDNHRGEVGNASIGRVWSVRTPRESIWDITLACGITDGSHVSDTLFQGSDDPFLLEMITAKTNFNVIVNGVLWLVKDLRVKVFAPMVKSKRITS